MFAVTIGLGIATIVFLVSNGFFTTQWLLFAALPATLFLGFALIVELLPYWKAWLKQDEEETNRVKDARSKLPPPEKRVK